jgi:aryl-alcohol dehydrogenase-like predicted oxidoreductase
MSPFRLYPSAPPISPLCLGSSTFGREIDRTAAFALMDGAVERQINFFDTAATYSAGAAEEIIGAWLASRRPDPAKLMVATKIYPPFTPEAIDQATAASARRLGVETIDLLYLHKWDAGAETPEALTALDGLVKAGRVRSLGVSNFTEPQFRTVLELQKRLGLPAFRLLQNNNNLAVRDVTPELRQLCSDFGVGIVTYSPLGAGFLTGKHRGGVTPGSRFDLVPGHQAVYFKPECERRLARLAEISARTGHPMAHLALSWAMHRSGVVSVLIGGRGPAHLDQAFAALALEAPELWAELESV